MMTAGYGKLREENQQREEWPRWTFELAIITPEEE